MLLPLGRLLCTHSRRTTLRRLGVLFSVTEADVQGQARVAALKLGLLEHGWIEGRNLEVDYRWGGGDSPRLRAYAAELTALNPT